MHVKIPCQRKVIEFFGEEAQAMVQCEECAELIQSISKLQRAKNMELNEKPAIEHLTEEMADVLVCMGQMQELYGISDDALQEMVNRKTARQEARISGYA